MISNQTDVFIHVFCALSDLICCRNFFLFTFKFGLKKSHTSCGSWLSYYVSCFNLDPVALRRKLSLVMPHVMKL